MADMQNINMQQVAAGMQGIGGIATAMSQKSVGVAQQTSANFEADQLDNLAGQERASSQRDAQEKRRQARLMQSRALAVASASGAGALDPNVVNTIAGLYGEGDLSARTSLYEGESRATGLEKKATARRFEGEQLKSAGNTKAISTIATTGLSIAEKYKSRKDQQSSGGWTSGYDLTD